MIRAATVVFLAFAAGSCGTPLVDLLGEVQGELCDARGHAVAGASVLVDGRSLHTDVDGHFRAFAVTPGRVSVVVGVDRGADRRRMEIEVPEHDIAVIFDEGCRSSDKDAPPFAALGVVPPA